MRQTFPHAVSIASAASTASPASTNRVNRILALAMGATISLLAMAPAPTRAADAQQLYLKGLAATCANCHGTDGKAQKDASVGGLAGLKADYIIEQMQAFRSGTRAATIMHQIAKGYNDEQVKQLADYFASQK
jgi:sulfide dehydrogenase cytochrome subunit